MLTLFRQIVKKREIEQLTRQLSILKISSKHDELYSEEDDKDKLLPIERLRMNALRIEQSENLRPRCRWSKDEDSKLLSLVSELGKRWTTISKEFVDRSPSNVANRYFLLTKCEERGPWSSEEIERLRELGRGRTYEEIDDWDEICKKLLRPRPYSLVKMTYKHSLDPRIKHGRWTEEESDRLERLVMRYGEDQMKLVAQLMGTRTKRQCLERWRWQMVNIKKGHFSEQEDKLILNAVKRYGENFAVICKVTGIQRTPRHVSQHYQNFLAPGLDRSPWTPEEEELVHKVCTENGRDMKKTKEVLKSNRSIRDMWNHFTSCEKRLKKKAIIANDNNNNNNN